jgi:hypothetical protein
VSLLSNPELRLSHRDLLLLLGLAILSLGIYLIVSGLYYRIGFPLDDAWIHQTYARNLALRGEWAFTPGQPSGGSTAPLWSALLSIGFWLKLAPYIWTYLLGALLLWSIAALGEYAVRLLVPAYRPRFPWIGTALALEWHLVWAAGSGMETLLSALLSVAVLTLLMAGSRRFLAIGLLIGLSVWVRPDGITLLGPVALTVFLIQPTWAKRLREISAIGLGFASLFAFYLLFNLAVSGSAWPNTFYAKQAEYAIYLQLSLWQRLGQQLLQPLIGVGIILLPGAIWMLIRVVRERNWGALAVMLWMLGFLGLYALRLPVTYQHGRYVIPAMPIFFILGLAGLADLTLRKLPRAAWFFPVFWKITVGLTLLIFYGRGAFAYAQDVAVIESEMVAVAGWISENIPPDALVAAHDIGALGYFGNHNLVDLAALISPDVVPFIRNEARLSDYLDERGVDYLVTFPDWYPFLTSNLSPVFTTRAAYAPALGETNMAVYPWPGP